METTLITLIKNNNTLVIFDRCLQSYPCKHDVTLNGEEKVLNGREIYKWCIKNNIEVPKHFQCYKNDIKIKF